VTVDVGAIARERSDCAIIALAQFEFRGSTARWIMRGALGFLLLFALAVPISGATTYLVRPDGNGDYPDIQMAIGAALDGDAIELSDGTFSGYGNRQIRYYGKAIIVFSQSANPATCRIDSEEGEAFVFDSSEGPLSVLSGVTILRGGVRFWSSAPSVTNCVFTAYGSGASYASPRFERCVFTAVPSPHTAISIMGAGTVSFEDCDFVSNNQAVSITEGGAAQFINCGFSSNIGHGGNGFYCVSSAVSFQSCRFLDNQGSGSGGAGQICEGTSDFTDCEFSGNSAVTEMAGHGGALAISGSNVRCLRCTFIGNSVVGGVYHDGGAVECSECSPVFEDCVFADNQATRNGGAICCSGASPSFSRCWFEGNSTQTGWGGAVYCREALSPTFEWCMFLGNEAADYGGALSCWLGSSPALSGCTFYGNAAPEGGAVFCRNSAPALENCILSFSAQGASVACQSGGLPSLSCCDIFGNAGGDWVGYIAGQFGSDGNISADPLFCEPENEDFTLDANSPCAPYSPANPECDLVGAWPVACGASSVPEPPADDPPTTATSWGALKSMFR
jgi:predicted outer membrane repeat protein